MSRIDAHLARLREGLRRLDPHAARQAVAEGAVLVDIRPVEQRSAHGLIPGAVVIDRNVMEWRVDPTSTARLPQFDDTQVHLIVVCQQGYQSTLAAATLQEIGLSRATDLVGGFEAWAAAGLPVAPWQEGH